MESDVVVNKIGKGNVVSTSPIPNSRDESWKDERLSMLRTLHQKHFVQKETTKPTEKPELKNVETGLATIPSVSEPLNTPITQRNQQQSYQTHLETYDLVGSESVKLIDESAKHLHERMLLTGSVVEAAMCADQIGKLIRLKLDIRVKTRD